MNQIHFFISLGIMNILITGGSGFIGSHLSDRLLKNDKNNLFLLDNLL